MRNLLSKLNDQKLVAAVVIVGALASIATPSFATTTADTDVQGLVTSGIDSLKTNLLAALVVIIPAAIVIHMAKKAWPLVRKFLHF